jgi:predicted Zn-dependent protease
MEFIMKVWLLALSAVLLALSYAAPQSFSQDQRSASPTDQNSSSSTAQSSPAAAAPAVEPADPNRVKHNGGKADVDAIGDRNVGCKTGVGNWYGVEKQVALGRQYAQQVEASVKLIQDPVITEYVNRVGQNIVRNSDAQVPFTIKVIDSDEINAFALPGGFFYVNSGLILAADEEAELAGVMAHEIGHVAACHAARENTRGNLLSLASIPLIFVGGPIGYAGYQAAGLALPVTFLHFSRAFEAEADYLGLQYMYKSGYDPNAFISFFEKVQAEEKKKPGALAKAFSTHPQTPDRIDKSQQEIAQLLPARAEYVVTTSEFDDVKERLAMLENRHKVIDQKESNKPSLRRSSVDKGSQDTKNDDDRPTLKRRDYQN